MAIIIEKISVGTKQRINALSFVGASDIHNAEKAHAIVLSINGTIMVSPTSPGMINISRVIPKYATLKPPNMAQSTRKSPI